MKNNMGRAGEAAASGCSPFPAHTLAQLQPPTTTGQGDLLPGGPPYAVHTAINGGENVELNYPLKCHGMNCQPHRGGGTRASSPQRSPSAYSRDPILYPPSIPSFLPYHSSFQGRFGTGTWHFTSCTSYKLNPQHLYGCQEAFPSQLGRGVIRLEGRFHPQLPSPCSPELCLTALLPSTQPLHCTTYLWKARDTCLLASKSPARARGSPHCSPAVLLALASVQSTVERRLIVAGSASTHWMLQLSV